MTGRVIGKRMEWARRSAQPAGPPERPKPNFRDRRVGGIAAAQNDIDLRDGIGSQEGRAAGRTFRAEAFAQYLGGDIEPDDT